MKERKRHDLAGKTYNFLTAISESHRIGRKTWWSCRCVCGKIVKVRSDQLKDSNTKSCGCIGKGPKTKELLDDKILPKLRKNVETGCIEWQGCLREGYGVVGHGRENVKYVHRIMYDECVGVIPKGLCVLHRCDNRRCCNPIHLFLGTRTDNAADRENKLRGAYGETRPLTKFTVKDAIEIIRLHKEGKTIRELSDRYGVVRQTIESLIRGESWVKAIKLAKRERLCGSLS